MTSDPSSPTCKGISPMTEISEHLRGPWVAVLADTDGFVYPSVEEAIDSLGEDAEVQISVVRGSAMPNDRNGTTGVLHRLPGRIHTGDVAYEVDAYLMDPDDESVGARARFEQAKAMTAGLNAAGQSSSEPGA